MKILIAEDEPQMLENMAKTLDGNLYILARKKPKLLIVDSTGKILELHNLVHDTFNQPEGIIFSHDGTMYISNEGKMEPPILWR